MVNKFRLGCIYRTPQGARRRARVVWTSALGGVVLLRMDDGSHLYAGTDKLIALF